MSRNCYKIQILNWITRIISLLSLRQILSIMHQTFWPKTQIISYNTYLNAIYNTVTKKSIYQTQISNETEPYPNPTLQSENWSKTEISKKKNEAIFILLIYYVCPSSHAGGLRPNCIVHSHIVPFQRFIFTSPALSLSENK